MTRTVWIHNWELFFAHQLEILRADEPCVKLHL